jgi:PIN domain-containing protein
MRTQFKGHFKETSESIKDAWRSATFVFDANVLLNLYRYSDEATDEFLVLLASIGERAWLPEQCAYELLANRFNVISEQSSEYSKTSDHFDELTKKFANKRGHPFISGKNLQTLEKVIKDVQKELSERGDAIDAKFSNDKTMDRIADIFEGRVGAAYSEEELKGFFESGASRFEAMIPPGYKDARKVKDPKTIAENRRNFGDYLLWCQTIDRAKSEKISIILVTDDRKEDWWHKVNGKTVGPRPELIAEFCSKTGQNILIYTPDNFLQFSKDQLGAKISANTIGEVEAEKQSREQRSLVKAKFSTTSPDSIDENSFKNWLERAQIEQAKGRNLISHGHVSAPRNRLSSIFRTSSESDHFQFIQLIERRHEILSEIVSNDKEKVLAMENADDENLVHLEEQGRFLKHELVKLSREIDFLNANLRKDKDER